MLGKKPRSNKVRDISIVRLTKVEKNLRVIFICLSNISALLGLTVVDPKKVVPVVNEVFGVDILQINKKTGKPSRKDHIAKARQIARFILAKYTNISFTDIAELTGSTDHSTVSQSVTKLENLLEVDALAVKELDACIMKLVNTYTYESIVTGNLRKATSNGSPIPEVSGLGITD